jgi:hypothetical protein
MKLDGKHSTTRVLQGLVALFVVVYVVTVLITGEPEWILVGVLIALIALAIFGFAALGRRHLRNTHGGDLEAALADSNEPLPSSMLIGDDDTPLGDTKEAHDEISPHDLPINHPGRLAAEEQAGGTEGTTRGNDQGGAEGRDGEQSSSTQRSAPA